MNDFLWKIAGGDVYILKKSDDFSKNTFKLIGTLFLINIFYIFFSTTALFTGVFDDFFIGVFVGLILSFLISSIYLLNILDLEPRTLPRNELDKKSFYFTYFTRFSSLFLLSIFIIKSMENFLFKHLFILNFKPQKIVYEVINLNKQHLEIWIFTIISMILFFSPIFIKYRLKSKLNDKEKNYYQLKKNIDVQLVLDDYEKFLKLKNLIYSKLYQKYFTLNELYISTKKRHNQISVPEHQFRVRKFKIHKSRYADPPFNTKLIDAEKDNFSFHEEYLKTLTDNGNLAEGN